MVDGTASPSSRPLEGLEDLAVDSRRWLRDLGALLALPAMWVDHDPGEVVTGLLSVLAGVLQVDAAYARFDDVSGDRPLEAWRPSGSAPAAHLASALDPQRVPAQGVETIVLQSRGAPSARVTRLPLALPWASGLVVVSSTRSDFPTPMELHLLRVAVGQAAIAIHTAQRLTRERDARTAAERMLRDHAHAVELLVEEIEPALAGLARRIREVSRADDERRRTTPASEHPARASGPDDDRRPATALTRRETEVLGLLAQGLSNKEIAGTLWLSDRTVERHITSLYRKIGVARRSEATAFALRHGVTS